MTHEELLSLVDYEPSTGKFRWKKSRPNARAGAVLKGSECGKGYVGLCIKYKRYYAHRLAWFYVHGRWPKQIDHINGVRDDNRLCNLRESDQSQNLANASRRKDNTTGYKGVSRHARSGRFMAMVECKGVKHYLGMFKTAEEAAAVRRREARKIFGEFSKD